MIKHTTLIAAAIALVGCFPNKGSNTSTAVDGFTAKLVVAAASPDYSTADVAVVGTKQDSNFVVIEQQIHTTNPSDINVAVFGDEIYRLGRYGFDNITKYNWNADATAFNIDWQYSVLGDDISANPYDMLVVSNTKAYVTRFDAQELWQVNPSADSAADFKTAAIDLSAYANASSASGVPHMSDMALVGDHLFVMLTRLNGWAADAPAKVVVINVNDNSIVDTDTTTAGTQVITLPVHNAGGFKLVNNQLYIVGKGDQSFGATTYKYTGGIVKLNPTTFATELLVDDGDSDSAPYGQITNVAATTTGGLYFTGSLNWGNDKLYFLAAGASTAEEISLGEGQYNISDLSIVDNTLFVAVHAQTNGDSAGLKTVSLTTNQVTGLIETTYNPTQVVSVD